MIYQLLWKKLILEKNRTLNFQLLKNVKLVKDQDQNLAMMLIHVLCVVVMVKLDQVRDSLQFNKHVPNVQVQEKK